MPADIATKQLACTALLTGAAVLSEDTNGRVACFAGESAMRLDDPAWEDLTGMDLDTCTAMNYLRAIPFNHMADILAESIADISLNDPDNYVALLKAIQNAGTCGHVLMRPAHNNWPDAAKLLVHWATEENPMSSADRCFPALPLLDMISSTPDPGQNLSDTDIDAWCEEYPDNLLLQDGPAGSLIYSGWNQTLHRRIDLIAEKIDFAKPWRVVTTPDGSEISAPADPLVLLDARTNYYGTPKT